MIAEKLIIVAISMIAIGIIILAISSMMLASQQQSKENKSKIDVGFGGFIGPIPFGFFTSRGAFWMWLAIAALAIILFFVLRRP